ncbi:MAG: DUF6438 domain-containing protein [Myxococcaceae bacterium]
MQIDASSLRRVRSAVIELAARNEMRLSIWALASLACVLEGCRTTAGEGSIDSTAEREPIIILSADICAMGVCPKYEVQIFEDGEVTYFGMANVAILGTRTGRISPAAVQNLVTMFEKANFCALKDHYPASIVFDAPSTDFSFRCGENKKVIEVANIEDAAPAELSHLEKKIDELVGLERWVGSQLVRSQLRNSVPDPPMFDALPLQGGNGWLWMRCGGLPPFDQIHCRFVTVTIAQDLPALQSIAETAPMLVEKILEAGRKSDAHGKRTAPSLIEPLRSPNIPMGTNERRRTCASEGTGAQGPSNDGMTLGQRSVEAREAERRREWCHCENSECMALWEVAQMRHRAERCAVAVRFSEASFERTSPNTWMAKEGPSTSCKKVIVSTLQVGGRGLDQTWNYRRDGAPSAGEGYGCGSLPPAQVASSSFPGNFDQVCPEGFTAELLGP